MENPFQPFDPDPDSSKPSKRKAIPFRLIAPNAVTLLALCAGLTAIRMGLEGRFEAAITAVVIAAVLDGLDGRLARLLKASSKFGAELDSLSDFVCFGVTPALLLYLWGLNDIRSFGWIACLIYVICMALRLARFNSQLENEKPSWQTRFFTGVPAPAGAFCALLPIYVSELGVPITLEFEVVALFYVIFIALLTVSRIPSFSGKTLGTKIRSDYVLPIFIAVVAFVAVMATFPWATLAVCVGLYIGSLMLSWRTWNKLASNRIKSS